MLPRYLVDFNLGTLPRVQSDFLVIGSGIAGLYTALKASERGRVILLTKRRLEDCNTGYAQGGIAAAIGDDDSPRLHLEDTLRAGAGLCDLEAVEIMVNEGPQCVLELVKIGTQFDKAGPDFALTREGAHSERRILHARGDATGEEIRRALTDVVIRQGMVEIHEDVFAVDLLTVNGACIGVLALDSPSGRLLAYCAGSTVLATGGGAQMYRNSTNPEVATADGIGMAFRAGADIMDMEFVQFHPTALHHPGSPKFLISEAVRGEGAVLVNTRGERFMPGYHPLAELAPRDVVARAIAAEMRRTGSEFVWLDATVLGSGRVRERFPTIYRTCLTLGLDVSAQPIPVAPAAHYMMGGIRTDVNGRTNLPGLYACGETAGVGVHGANRLASNSLLEGLVFGKRISRDMTGLTGRADPCPDLRVHLERGTGAVRAGQLRSELQALMWDKVGISRNGPELREALSRIDEIIAMLDCRLETREEFELANLAAAARLVTLGALQREESRGAHHRLDFPERDDHRWQKHTIFRSRGPGSERGAGHC